MASLTAGSTVRRPSLRRALALLSLYVCLSFGLSVCGSASAAETSLTLKQLQHTAWSSKDGAPVEISALAQTVDGMLWIGTTTGLVRFDGFNFEPWEPPVGQPPMTSRNISTLYAGKDGSLWIGFRFGGISQLRNGHLTDFGTREGLPAGDIQEIAPDAQGALWTVAANRLMQLEGEHWVDRSGAFSTTAGRQPIERFVFDRDGCLWAAVLDHIAVQQHGSHSCSSIHQSVEYATGFVQAPAGGLWLSDYWRPVQPLLTSGVRPAPRLGPQRWGSNALLFASDGALWVATVKHGILRRTFTPGMQTVRDESFAEAEGLTSAQTVALLQDREGNLWVGTSRGLDRFSLPKFVPWRGASLHDSPALAARAEGGLWIADPFYKLYSSTSEGTREVPLGTSAYALYTSPRQILWIAALKHLSRYDHGQVTRYLLPPGTADFVIQGMVEDSAGDLLVSFTYSGLWRLSHGKWTRGLPVSVLPKITPLSMMTDSVGRTWFGYADGSASLWDGAHVRPIPASGDLGGLLVFHENRERIWAGGSRGLAIFNGTAFRSVALADLASLQGISGIAFSRSGDLWLNGAKGIIRTPAGDVERAVTDPAFRMTSQLFDYHDGVTGHAPQLRPLPSAIADSDGHIWFSTSGSAIAVDPEHLPSNPVPPLVSIESITVDGRKLNAGSSLTLGIRPHKVQIAFVGISLSSPDRVHYRYLLEHEDAGWQEGGTDHVVSYTNLAPGTYRFLVSARSSDGVWSKASAVSTFSIPPAFTQTRTFAASSILASIALLWLLYTLRMGYVTARVHERMRDRVSERLRIARDLHDTLLQGVQGLIMRLHFTAAQMPQADATQQTLMSALDRADEVLEESRNSLLRLRSEEGADPDLAETLRSLAAQLMHDSYTSFTLAVDGEQRPLQSLIHEELSFIFREALTNALQHARANTIHARLSYAPDELHLLLRDDGIGLSAITMKSRLQQGHWGIQGMRERAARIGGSIRLSSVPEEGTIVELCVPARSAYPLDPSLNWWIRILRALTVWREFALPTKAPGKSSLIPPL